ncbi:2,3-bisphosphoglycerate-independent phosphoglycerate mutase [uncultured Litoreibacter sp.]|uniref:2,3-bisphosphoglycerate-independent phosphoglycerate mutase n=1 Tax=uncultured Litoreibacter sp. TaxID=1392394 RepID=UPI0026102631|nr:2,3-bisphosphoglycerate-independent phosphoglycerate mutase [uncultured Litoreibacter sp.]
MTTPKPVVLCILDGWGLSDTSTANAPALANTPHFDRLMANDPNATLVTHGPDVGLPKGQMGNSEVGHTNIGAGRVVAMDLGQIDLAIEDGSFAQEAALLDLVATLKDTGGTAHLMGVASDGGVHGHITHVIAAAKALSSAGIDTVLHAITDGRDVAPKSALGYIETLEQELPDDVRIVTVSGRYYAMDRDTRWDRVQLAYKAMIDGEGEAAQNATAAINDSYAKDKTDEFISPTVIEGFQGVKDGDAVFCLNFRADRAREILSAIADPAFDAFDVSKRPKLAECLGMVDYSTAHNAFMTTVFPKKKITNTLGSWVAQHGLRQFRVAETEKYPHVTFFLNGGKETPEDGEDRNMPKSPKVATYDLQPEMSADEVATDLVNAISERYDLIVVNFANPDMVGHTGDLAAAIAACEAVDAGLGQAISALDAVGGAIIVTADHGNCETMVDPVSGGPHTAHTTNLVPVVLHGGPKGVTLADGRLADLAPTLLELMNLPKPKEMTGVSLIRS